LGRLPDRGPRSTWPAERLERPPAHEQAVVVTQPRTTQVALAGRLRPGDRIARDGRVVEILRVRRAQDRKPPQGENLHLVGADELIKVNSLEGIRILPRGD
jgi:hypothetical protein